jgi:hypothetical protein
MTSWAVASRRSFSIDVLRVSHDVQLVRARIELMSNGGPTGAATRVSGSAIPFLFR